MEHNNLNVSMDMIIQSIMIKGNQRELRSMFSSRIFEVPLTANDILDDKWLNYANVDENNLITQQVTQ